MKAASRDFPQHIRLLIMCVSNFHAYPHDDALFVVETWGEKIFPC